MDEMDEIVLLPNEKRPYVYDFSEKLRFSVSTENCVFPVLTGKYVFVVLTKILFFDENSFSPRCSVKTHPYLGENLK